MSRFYKVNLIPDVVDRFYPNGRLTSALAQCLFNLEKKDLISTALKAELIDWYSMFYQARIQKIQATLDDMADNGYDASSLIPVTDETSNFFAWALAGIYIAFEVNRTEAQEALAAIVPLEQYEFLWNELEGYLPSVTENPFVIVEVADAYNNEYSQYFFDTVLFADDFWKKNRAMIEAMTSRYWTKGAKCVLQWRDYVAENFGVERLYTFWNEFQMKLLASGKASRQALKELLVAEDAEEKIKGIVTEIFSEQGWIS